jgi:cytochrome c556
MKIKAHIPAAILLASGLLAGNSTALAATDENPLQLRKIMQALSADMQQVVGATATEDWKQVEQAAARIADHPTPPFTEKLRIFAFMGSKVSEFKTHDGKTHQAAKALQAAAVEQDGAQVIAKFAALQVTCLQCHQNYREAFRQHFYQPQEMQQEDSAVGDQ